jgi:RNA polymerase sigma factor (sigma-70 family)
MSEPDASVPEGAGDLDEISTEWSGVHNPQHFLLRYAAAIRRYLLCLLNNAQDADDVAQEFFLGVVQHGFVRADPDRGRFRDYLKVAVRNAAISHLRRRQRRPERGDTGLDRHAAAGGPSSDEQWLTDWRGCLLDRVWRALEQHQHRSPGNQSFTVLRLSVQHPDEDSTALAARAGEGQSRPLSAEAFRKQLSRARRLFAELLVREVGRTLENPTPAAIEEELSEIGLLHHVQPYLPPDWPTHGRLADPD